MNLGLWGDLTVLAAVCGLTFGACVFVLHHPAGEPHARRPG